MFGVQYCNVTRYLTNSLMVCEICVHQIRDSSLTRGSDAAAPTKRSRSGDSDKKKAKSTMKLQEAFEERSSHSFNHLGIVSLLPDFLVT